MGDEADHDAHDAELTLVGRMAPTGTPWDRAILVPIETVWEIHGLANGHAPEADDRIGPPFDPAYFPGTPAVVVRATSLAATYALQSEFTRDAETMAFFPGTVLANLHRIMGDVRQAMSLMSMVTQVLVAASVLLGLFILTRLFQRQLALLRALGAPARFVAAVIWSYGAVLVGTGALLGLAVGLATTALFSTLLSARMGLRISAGLGWPEVHAVAAFVGVTGLICLLPAVAVLRGSVAKALRA